MKKLVIAAIIAIITIIIGLALLRGDEDNWICEKGKWIKHGNPLEPEPKIVCENREVMDITADKNQAESNISGDTPISEGIELDEHGCSTGAGASWCESRQKCLEKSEESCPDQKVE